MIFEKPDFPSVSAISCKKARKLREITPPDTAELCQYFGDKREFLKSFGGVSLKYGNSAIPLTATNHSGAIDLTIYKMISGI